MILIYRLILIHILLLFLTFSAVCQNEKIQDLIEFQKYLKRIIRSVETKEPSFEPAYTIIKRKPLFVLSEKCRIRYRVMYIDTDDETNYWKLQVDVTDCKQLYGIEFITDNDTLYLNFQDVDYDMDGVDAYWLSRSNQKQIVRGQTDYHLLIDELLVEGFYKEVVNANFHLKSKVISCCNSEQRFLELLAVQIELLENHWKYLRIEHY